MLIVVNSTDFLRKKDKKKTSFAVKNAQNRSILESKSGLFEVFPVVFYPIFGEINGQKIQVFKVISDSLRLTLKRYLKAVWRDWFPAVADPWIS